MGESCSTYVGEEEPASIIGGMDGWILVRWDGVMWTGLVWLRIGTGGELL
jgi:hypothetical protein